MRFSARSGENRLSKADREATKPFVLLQFPLALNRMKFDSTRGRGERLRGANLELLVNLAQDV
jgi:hypothetical protein